MSQKKKTADTFCKSEESDVVNFDEHEFMVLHKTIEPIRAYSKDYLEGKIDTKEAYNKINTEYRSYKCIIKKDLESNRQHRDSVKDIFKVVIFVASCVYSLYVVRQIFRFLIGYVDCSGSKYKLPILYSIVSLILFNPLFSLITVTSNLIKYRASNAVSAESRNRLFDFEQAIEEVLNKCVDNPSLFTKEEVCTFYKFLVSDCGHLCTKDCSSNEENILSDFIGNKMEKMDNIDQFFNNQKQFVYKEHNMFIDIKDVDQIDPTISFLLGNNIEDTVRKNLNVNDDEFVISTNSDDIRNDVTKHLQLLEGYKYSEIGEVESYSKYFIDKLNEKLISLTDNVLRLLETSNEEQRKKYFDENTLLSNYGIRGDYLFHYSINPDGYKPPYEDDVINDMMFIQNCLRRLNKLWLPEYENLRKILYESESYSVDVKIQKSLYRAKTTVAMKALLKEIITIVLENTNFIDFENFEDVCKNEVYYPKATDCNGGSSTHKLIKAKDNISVTTLYGEDYKHKETLLMPKVSNFIKNLRKDVLPKDYNKQYKMESEIISRVFINNLEPYLKNESTLINYISVYLDTNQIFSTQDEQYKQIFQTNFINIVKDCNRLMKKESKNSDLYFDSTDGIEYPHRYITYQEFELKLLNIDKQQFNKYSKSVEKATKSMTYFMDKIGTLDNKTEEKYQMTQFYEQFIYIYIAASFFVLVDLCITQYYGRNYLDYQADIICIEHRENERQLKQAGIKSKSLRTQFKDTKKKILKKKIEKVIDEKKK